MKTTKGIGTPLYMAPEVLDGDIYDKSADVYSFGLIIHVLFSEVLPFSDENILGRPWEFAAAVRKGKRPTVDQSWPPEIQEMMESSWAATPATRPSFSELHVQLQKLLGKILPPI